MKRISSGSPWEPVIGFSRAVQVGDRILVSGTAPVWPDGSCDPDPAAQMRRCLEIIGEALTELDAGFEDVVRTRMYLVDTADAEAVGRVHGEVFGELRPAATMVVVAGLLDERWRVEVEAEAVVRSASVVGIDGGLEVGLAHLSPEERKKLSQGEPNLLGSRTTRAAASYIVSGRPAPPPLSPRGTDPPQLRTACCLKQRFVASVRLIHTSKLEKESALSPGAK